ncbi:MAG TPA: TRAP transporter small permease subunit [Alphaproteobacteria bacterium]|nr:TRAP transporter small permease subunit [Alphaproteobacteria bacterium]
MIETLTTLVRLVDRLNDTIGRFVAWLTLGTALICFLTVYLRYVLNFGFIWLQELYVAEHAIVFMIGAGYTLLYGGHVRVDIFYARMSARRKAWVDLVGTLVFMAPFLVVVWIYSLPFVRASWSIFEPSSQPGGMDGVFILKSGLLLFCALVGLQAVAMVARCSLVIAGREEFARSGQEH